MPGPAETSHFPLLLSASRHPPGRGLSYSSPTLYSGPPEEMMRTLLPSICLLLLAGDAPGEEGPAAPQGIEFFEKKIRPILVEHCYGCHSTASKKLKGGLLLDSREGIRKGGESGRPSVVPGKPEESLLIQAVRYT